MKPDQPAYYFTTPDEAESAFYSAFEMADLQLMDDVLADQDVSCVHPASAALIGREAVLDSWKKILSNIKEPAFYTDVLSRSVVGNMAVHLVAERIARDHQPDSPTSLLLATNVYVHQENGWRLLVHHSSAPPHQQQSTQSSDPVATHEGPHTLQ
jgi:ketosteroid isomerase-like protein